MRLAAHSDIPFRRRDGRLATDESFVLFLAPLGDRFDLTLAERVEPGEGDAAYGLPPGARLVELPWYASLAEPRSALRSVRAALRAWGRIVGEADVVWLQGPHPLAALFALAAARRGRRVVLGVRQDFPRYVATRHPGRRSLAAAAWALEGTWRALARRFPVVVVGPELAAHYRGARALLPMVVSVVREEHLAPPEAADRDWEGELTLLSVGRLDDEKNPLLLADILARLRSRSPRWRLVVCGDGVLRDALGARARDLGVADALELRGFLPQEELRELYRSSDAFLHVSWTEGVPQVLVEAFAAALPVVGTDVGGVRSQAEGAALLVGPGDAEAAAAALERLLAEPELRSALAREGRARAASLTLEAQAREVADFLAGRAGGAGT